MHNLYFIITLYIATLLNGLPTLHLPCLNSVLHTQPTFHIISILHAQPIFYYFSLHYSLAEWTSYITFTLGINYVLYK